MIVNKVMFLFKSYFIVTIKGRIKPININGIVNQALKL